MSQPNLDKTLKKLSIRAKKILKQLNMQFSLNMLESKIADDIDELCIDRNSDNRST